jgi:hypothetical protein
MSYDPVFQLNILTWTRLQYIMYVQISSNLRVENYVRIPRFRFAVFTWHPSSVNFIYQSSQNVQKDWSHTWLNCSLQGRDPSVCYCYLGANWGSHMDVEGHKCYWFGNISKIFITAQPFETKYGLDDTS